MTTSEVLYAGADHIQKHGHHKGGPYAPGVDINTAPACIAGALSRGHKRVTGRSPGPDDLAPLHAAVREYLGQSFVAWNDAPERTADEAVAALRATAVITAAREHQAAAAVRTLTGVRS